LTYFSAKRIKFGKNFICKWDIKIKGPGKVMFRDNVNAWTNSEPNSFETYSKNAIIKIGVNTRLNGAQFQSRESIEVGDDCVIGSSILIDTEFHPVIGKRSQIASDKVPTKSIEIGNNVWIGGKSAILKGVKVGRNSIIGFGSIVRKDIPQNSVVIGNPAEIVKTLDN